MERTECARLAERFGPAVYRLAYARTGNAADAEDVTQDVFLRLLTKAPAFADDDHAKAWLLRVAANRASDLFRSPWRRPGRRPSQPKMSPARPWRRCSPCLPSCGWWYTFFITRNCPSLKLPSC